MAHEAKKNCLKEAKQRYESKYAESKFAENENKSTQQEPRPASQTDNNKDKLLRKTRIWYWSPAERTTLITAFNSAYKRLNLNDEWEEFMEMVEWCDMRRLFYENEFVMSGCWGYSLKQIARAMYAHGLIDEIWPEAQIDNGLACMVALIRAEQLAARLESGSPGSSGIGLGISSSTSSSSSSSSSSSTSNQATMHASAYYSKSEIYNRIDVQMMYLILKKAREIFRTVPPTPTTPTLTPTTTSPPQLLAFAIFVGLIRRWKENWDLNRVPVEHESESFEASFFWINRVSHTV